MTINDALKESIIERAHILIDASGILRIDEPENIGTHQLQAVDITGINQFYGAIKLDVRNTSFTGKLIKDGYLKKACDAIVFCKIKQQDCIFLIELKSNTASHIPEKMKNGYAFIEYLRSIFLKYHGLNIKNGFQIIPVLFDRKPSSRSNPSKRKLKGINFFHKGFGKPVGKVDLRIYL